ncbi:hypothetical protein UFOVP176_7 [uncultured Caudovirales phage]|uniref:Uncharacterized protein n=1 Tax=uncultured Caudovirales phage TaxID=2100421 RepID=A0A6J7WA77_9CAUD|nr:hypothetical protein UFOVP176_7 [uncultured Caudovirales phage]
MGLLSTVGGLAGTYFGGPLGGMAGSAIGGALEGGASVAGGMQQSQAAQDAARQAAIGSQFRPVGITNTFGTSNFGYDPTTGQMTSAGYTLSPTLQSAQNSLMGGFQGNLQDQANIQAMGRQYLAQSPQEAAQQWMANQQAILQPSRDMAQAGLNNSMFNSGTGGLSVAQGTGMASANPQQQALANAQALQNLQLAGQAQQQGQNQYTFGQGLLSSSYDPYNAALKTSAATEQLGQSPFTLSTGLASSAANAGANAGKYLTSPAATYSPSGTLLSSLGNASAGIFGSMAPSDLQNTVDGWLNPYTIDTSGAGLGTWGGTDTGIYGGAGGLSIR